MWQWPQILRYALHTRGYNIKYRGMPYIKLADGDNCIVFANFMASIVDLMVANIRLLALLTQFATIKSPINAVKLTTEPFKSKLRYFLF
jgi:hypothetical protein